MEGKKIIGLTGPYCAGKNHIAHLLEQRLFPVLDIDKLGHEVIESEKDHITALFGADIIGRQGFVDRRKLGEKVFGKPKELAALEDIVHPAVNKKTLEWIAGRKEKACFINAALLHRSSAYEVLDAVILVDAPVFVRLRRARERDHLPWVALLKRFWSQRKFKYQLFTKKTDIYSVSNHSDCFNSGRSGVKSLNKLQKRIDEILSLQGIGKV